MKRIILFFLLSVFPCMADEASLLKQIGARKDTAGNIFLGGAFIRKNDRTISFPGKINLREGVIEVLVSTRRGRMHESLIVTEVDPFHLQMALILAGYKNGPRETGAPFRIEIVYGASKRVRADEWLFDNTLRKPCEKWVYFFAGSSFQDGVCLASQEGNLININSLDKNTILNASLDRETALHEYIVRKEKLPEPELKNPDSPLEGFREIPVRVILIPVSDTALPMKKDAKAQISNIPGPEFLLATIFPSCYISVNETAMRNMQFLTGQKT